VPRAKRALLLDLEPIFAERSDAIHQRDALK
jgi:hypothetical protein